MPTDEVVRELDAWLAELHERSEAVRADVRRASELKARYERKRKRFLRKLAKLRAEADL